MSADFFHGKVHRRMVGGIAFVFVLLCSLYALFLSHAKEMELKTGFFYLVRNDVHAEVGAEFIKLEGGAGYLLRKNGRDYAVVSVYLCEKDALAVQATTHETGIIYEGVDTLYFKTAQEKKNAAVYVGALNILYDGLSILNGAISLLEDGATQERVKGILLPLSSQFAFLANEYEQRYTTFSSVCRRCAERLQELCAEILFVGDLRYELCALTGEYLALARSFSI